MFASDDPEPMVLVVHYSRTGRTRHLAREIAGIVPCEIEEILDDRDRSGVAGALWSGLESVLERRVHIRTSRFDPGRFDLVIIGTPIYGGAVASPVRAYLDRHRGHLGEVAFFGTCDGAGLQRGFRKLEALVGHAPRAVLGLRSRELGDSRARAAAFVAECLRTLAVSPSVLAGLGAA